MRHALPWKNFKTPGVLCTPLKGIQMQLVPKAEFQTAYRSTVVDNSICTEQY